MQDILYCEANRSYTNFHLSDKSHIIVSNTLGDYEEMFGEYGFLRIHQSYLLNVTYIERFEKGDGGKVVLADNTSLPVGTRKKEQLLQLLATLKHAFVALNPASGNYMPALANPSILGHFNHYF